MQTVLRYGNGNIPRCPLRDAYCDSNCAWLQRDEEGGCVCSVTLLCVTDTFCAPIMDESVMRGFGWNSRRRSE